LSEHVGEAVFCMQGTSIGIDWGKNVPFTGHIRLLKRHCMMPVMDKSLMHEKPIKL